MVKIKISQATDGIKMGNHRGASRELRSRPSGLHFHGGPECISSITEKRPLLYCGTGCSVYLDVKGDKVIGVTTDELDTVGRGNLCVKGRFGFAFIHHHDRLKSPLIKSNGVFREASGDDALSLIAGKLLEIKDKYGPESIGGIGSARATNEDNYMFQRMMRAAIGTNNIDNCARLCHMPAASFAGTVFTSFHLSEIPINMLTGGARDTYTDTYSYKFTAVRVEGID